MQIDTEKSPILEGLAEFEAKAEKAASLLRAMANERRLMILCRLVGGEASVGALQDAIGLSQSALSQHLAKLREQQLVSVRRDGQSAFYRLEDPAAARVIETLVAVYCPEMLI